jgi:hypothetical protein
LHSAWVTVANMGIFKRNDSRQARVEIELNSKLFEQVNSVIEHFKIGVTDTRVPFDPDQKQSIDIVGESNFQEALQRYMGGTLGDVWVNGVLLPEPDNKFDPNAILLYLINDEFWIDPVGYLPKEVAQKVIRPISNLLVQGQILPVKCKLVDASGTMPNIGVKAWVKSAAVKFP